jgi:hypothetical protein
MSFKCVISFIQDSAIWVKGLAIFMVWTCGILSEIQISADRESSRPRELPPQSLTETDVNLSIHPALIDQPIVVPIASAQTGKTFVWQCARASKMLCACDGVTFCTSAWPIVAMCYWCYWGRTTVECRQLRY